MDRAAETKTTIADSEARIGTFPRSRKRRGLVEQPEAEDAPESAEGVLQTDLLAFLVGAAGVADRDLEDAPAPAAGDPRRDLRLESEPGRLQANSLQHLAAEDLVARFHVGQVEVCHHVRQHGQDAVGDGMPEVEHAMALADEARAVDDVGAALDDRLQESWILRGIVFEIGVLHDDGVAGGMREAAAEGSALALVPGMEHDADVVI